MDQKKTGKFIAELRRREGLTQEALGERIGVTNKTISRWENGNYMPDIGMFRLLAEEFHVSINELLAGERIPDEICRQDVDRNKDAVPEESVFSPDERKAYFKKKWRREHILLLAVLGIVLTASAVLPFVAGRPEFVGLVPLIAFMEYGYQNNKMMMYVEKHLYE